jgi:hypothetical protein
VSGIFFKDIRDLQSKPENSGQVMELVEIKGKVDSGQAPIYI